MKTQTIQADAWPGGPAEARRLVALVGPTDLAVLVTGETGSGKERAARAVHAASGRQGLFVAVDCGAMPSELVASTLFGHVKGAFTGAAGDRTGAFQQAAGGTLFLDEVGNLRPDDQAVLLRALQEGIVRRVGAEADERVDVRIVSATNIDLVAAAEDGRFRLDLLHRLNEFPVRLPPLRDRADEIPLFVDGFLNEAAVRIGRRPSGITDAAMDKLKSFKWPGNLRELRNVITRAALMAGDGMVDVRHLLMDGDAEVDEKAALETALTDAAGNKTQAALKLGVSRRTLYAMMERNGLSVNA